MSRPEGFPAIETERLILRELADSDAEALLEHFSDPELVRYIDCFDLLSSLEQAQAIIDRGREEYARNECVLWGVDLKADERLVGTVRVRRLREQDGRSHRACITYDLARPYWGQGYMPEVLQHLLPYIFEQIGVIRLQANVHVHNYRSARVLLKSGFQMEGFLRQYARYGNQLADVMLFALLREDWRRAHQSTPMTISPADWLPGDVEG